MTNLIKRRLTMKERKFLNKFSKMAWKRPSQFVKWYSSLSNSQKEFLNTLKKDAHLNPHLFDLENIEQVQIQLSKEYEEDFG